ncbi:DMR6-LIKE OXYGENASE 2 [Hibiscus trionum]|uniref:DMR6-LIKE OXYGENASE 2 n=1 Tax=Hibiscus trionum TaxID=183268 RepID=A0A9W7LZI2_HIBTR|nr:DMR6-LIKE OXYGENASE 2 [Hibiscus trionum]
MAAIDLIGIGSQSLTHLPPKLTSVKALLAESPALSSLPSSYTFPEHRNDEAFSDTNESIPTLDFSLLTSSNPDERSKMIQELGNACQDWGFFMVTNHGVPESLMKAMIEACRQFFELTEEEKGEYEGKHVLDPIRSGTSFNASVDKVLYWRDYLKIFQHPEFHSPNKPPAFREIAMEYSTRVRQVARELIRGISESLGLEENYIEKAVNLENSLQIMIANLYPPCPQPELAMGLPAHSDHGLVTLLIQNEIGGLQVQHNGKWVNVDPIPNSFLANIGDHVEILGNGKYKSVLHRAVVNNRDVRISIALSNGPALDAAVSPASKFLEDGRNPPTYRAMKYKEYVELQQSNKLDGKSCLERIRNTTI